MTMISTMRRSVSARSRGDDGIAMVVSISLMGIVAVLVLALVSVALSEARGTGRDRQRSVAVMSAEGRVDSLLATIQSTAPADLPCGTLAPTSQSVMSDQLAVGATVKYFDEAGAEIPCSSVPTATTIRQATIKASTTSQAIVGTSAATRSVETLVRLTPNYGNTLDKAIFGHAGVSVSNNGQVTTANGQPTADIYTNGSFLCDGNQTYQGSIHAQGSITFNNGSSCVVAVDAHAGTFISANDPSTVINGRALAGGGNILIRGTIGQHARATGTVTGSACSPASKCQGGVAVPKPPTEVFPQITWPIVGAKWQTDLGFTRIVTDPVTCGAPGPGDKTDRVGKWIEDNAAVLTANTVLLSSCTNPVYMSGVNLNFSHNFAVFSAGGIQIDGNPTISSTTATSRNLYFIQPFGTCPANPGIYLGNNITFTNRVQVMLYSPCDIDKRNQSDVFGQIYSGGHAYLRNKTAMTFVLLPMAGLDVTSAKIESYNVEILYKRENV